MSELRAHRQDAIFQAFVKYCRSKKLVAPGERVLVSVSGGLDSTVLAHLMVRFSALEQFYVELAHIDHKTRAEASKRESVWVQTMGARWNVAVKSLEVKSLLSGGSQNEFRQARREIILDFSEEGNFHKIATAHHADDNAETFLFRALSGSGVKGLAGIAPLRRELRSASGSEVVWIRPLLSFTKSDLLEYARLYHLGWVEDPSNSRGDYSRNQIRQDLIPQLEKFRPGATACLARLSERIEEEESDFEEWVARELVEVTDTLSLSWLERWPRALRRRILRYWTESKLRIPYNPPLIERLVGGEEMIVPQGAFVHRADSLIFSREIHFGKPWQEGIIVDFQKRMDMGTSLAWSFLPSSPGQEKTLQLWLSFRHKAPENEDISHPLRIAWELTPWPLMIRLPRSGDPFEMIHTRLSAHKIPRAYWSAWPLLVSVENPTQIVGLLGLEILEPYRLKKLGRCVSIQSFFEDYLSGVSKSC